MYGLLCRSTTPITINTHKHTTYTRTRVQKHDIYTQIHTQTRRLTLTVNRNSYDSVFAEDVYMHFPCSQIRKTDIITGTV